MVAFEAKMCERGTRGTGILGRDTRIPAAALSLVLIPRSLRRDIDCFDGDSKRAQRSAVTGGGISRAAQRT
jgi:hypothetical protein